MSTTRPTCSASTRTSRRRREPSDGDERLPGSPARELIQAPQTAGDRAAGLVAIGGFFLRRRFTGTCVNVDSGENWSMSERPTGDVDRLSVRTRPPGWPVMYQ